MGGHNKTPKAPPPPAPITPMPIPDDEAVQQAKKRQQAQLVTRSGRASTILSDTGDKLGS